MLAAWLKKWTLTMGRSRWQSRYFVLLDTELRYYKDEHAATPSSTVNLNDIERVEVISVAGYRYCLQLCPKCTVRKGKPLILQFSAAIDLSSWYHAIQAKRPLKKKTIQSTSPSPTSPFSSQLSLVSTLDPREKKPMLFKNIIPLRRRPRQAVSLSRRRGIVLSSLSLEEGPSRPWNDTKLGSMQHLATPLMMDYCQPATPSTLASPPLTPWTPTSPVPSNAK
ncbi:hypothetical protein DM01DRAFT_1408031 [Hesseltinella vesiculosa]|uniref:PH domain-containing protein n=1 Tax=Hesseltinella vesiculosa TaxID=101127 RepID=A0A1X2GFM3_9FUNG|nr:hypothetical protein DM01DRAFT_1408031 [Hesseltinella vesiculosa]